jgi:PAS domain S-box-containing protein
MNALDGISINSKISLIIAGLIMMTFFAVQTCIVFGICEPTLFLAKFGWGCVVFFMPPFFKVVQEFLNKTKIKEAKINTQLNAIDKSNLIVTLGMDTTVLSANQNFLNVVGYSEDEILNSKHPDLCTTDFKSSKEYKTFWEKLHNGEFVSGEFERVNKNGESIWLFGTYTPLQNASGVYDKVLKIAVDITPQHKAEAEVKQKSIYLEHAAKIIRHDMHSGINTYIPRGLNSLQRRLDDEQKKKLRAPLQLLGDGVKHAQKVYSGVYEFTNLVKENAQMPKTPNNIKQILDEYLSLTAYKNQVLLDDNLPVSLEVNEPLFCTAIDNLIRNGLKYNDSPTKWVKIYFEGNYNKGSFIIIEDNGRGMTQSEFDELSKPYVRKEGQKEKGTGLGLNICKAILKEHGFELSIEEIEDDPDTVEIESGTKMRIKI